jgi:17beta-estradiol 17-dehydrogenase/3alpha(17beta)-hydroxysteroid dehydrogenase (NAD+)
MLSGKLALVTGGASGIGFQIAKALASEGASLCVVDVNKNIEKTLKQISNNNNQHSAYTCDVSSVNDVNKLFETIKQQYSSHKVPSIIVNSAGITRDNVLLKISEQDFDKVLQVNLKGTFLITQAATKELLLNHSKETNSDKSYASIINIGSIVGKLGNIGQSNYSASKAAVEGLTKSVARELGKYKIRCNCILPGFVRTPMTESIPEKHLARLKALIPLGRFGEPEEIAQLALFLATDLSSYITGTSIDCNGGLSY